MTTLETNVHRILEILLPKIRAQRSSSDRPIILGITGLQGSGKSTWAAALVAALSKYHNLRAIPLSLDDLYKTHDDLIAQRDKDPANKLYRTRGQPGTHDEQLAQDFFQKVKTWGGTTELKIPSFDKSKFNGEGDRAPEEEWPVINGAIDLIIFEGWCVGFQHLPDAVLQSKYEAAQASKLDNEPESTTTLADHQLAHLQEINCNLKRYNETFMGPQHFDFFIHLDTDELRNVYRWRLQQEHAMIRVKGAGMTDDAVRAFVRGYMPGYELYLEGLRKGFLPLGSGRQIRVVLGREREVEKVEVL